MSELFVTFHVAGTPRAKQSFRYTKNGGGFTPQTTKDWQNTVGWEAKIAMQGKNPHQGPVSVDLFFVIPGKKLKIDLDNLSKNVLDGMKQIIYFDDNQVHRLLIEKRYKGDDKQAIPGVQIIVRSMPE